MTEDTSKTEPEAKPKKRHGVFGFWSMMFYVIFIPPVLAGAFVFLPGPLKEDTAVIVPHGSSVYAIADRLDHAGVTINPVIFRLASRLLAKDQLQAGEFAFTPHQSIASVVAEMHEGHSVVRLFTAAEGLTSAEIVGMLNDVPLTGAVPVPTEGTLLPESYRYTGGDTRAAVISRMQKAMQDALTAAWAKRDSVVPLKSPQEAVIMASIIEKETGKPEERARIARVFYNRLQHSMRLQSDPTVIYAITMGKGPLNRSLNHDDLSLTNSPYNTYLNDGLPPGPICNPGRASIEAALHPEANDFLYFVADGTGGHVFAKDLAEHNQNVAKWSQIKAQGGQQQPASTTPQAH